jgi:hypothetical protein
MPFNISKMFFRKPQKMRNGLIILLGALGIGLITPDGVKDGPHGVPSGSTFTLEVNSIAQILNLFIDFLNLYYSLPHFPQNTAICGVFGNKEIDTSQRGFAHWCDSCCV